MLSRASPSALHCATVARACAGMRMKRHVPAMLNRAGDTASADNMTQIMHQRTDRPRGHSHVASLRGATSSAEIEKRGDLEQQMSDVSVDKRYRPYGCRVARSVKLSRRAHAELSFHMTLAKRLGR